MPSTRLNYDVLLAILSVSPPKTATSIMATCSFLYHEGAKIVLQDPVELKGSEEEALAVLRFLQAEDLSRCPNVRTLELVMVPTIPHSVAQILADLVPRMTGLKWLTLGHSEQLFELYPRLLPVFAGLRSLKMLVMIYIGERSTEMIRTLQSHLIYASIHFPPTTPLDSSLSIPISALQQSASTLERLLCACPVHTSLGRTFFNSSPTIIYPELRFLNLLPNFPPNPIPLMEAFPNLTRLRVVYEGGLKDEMLESYWSNRELNLSLQWPSRSRAGQPFGWRHLQEFTGHPADLWALGLACRIPQLTLRGTPSARASFIFTDVLTYARPTYLTANFENHSLTSVLEGGFLSALQSEGASGLRALALVIDLTAADRNLDFGHAMESIGSAFADLKLSDLLFVVRDVGLSETVATATPAAPPAPATALPSESDSVENPAPLSLSLAERTLRDFNVEQFSHALVEIIPTIQNIAASIEWPSQCGGGLRIGFSATCNYKWLGRMYTGGSMVYVDYQQWGVAHHYDREIWTSVVQGWNSHMAKGDVP